MKKLYVQDFRNKELSAKHQQYQSEFMAHSAQVDLEVEVLENILLKLQRHAAAIEQEINAAHLDRVNVEDEIKNIERDIDGLRRDIEAAQNEKRLRDQETRSLVEEIARAGEEFEREKAATNARISSLMTEIVSSCDKKNSEELIVRYNEMRKSISQINIKVTPPNRR